MGIFEQYHCPLGHHYHRPLLRSCGGFFWPVSLISIDLDLHCGTLMTFQKLCLCVCPLFFKTVPSWSHRRAVSIAPLLLKVGYRFTVVGKRSLFSLTWRQGAELGGLYQDTAPCGLVWFRLRGGHTLILLSFLACHTACSDKGLECNFGRTSWFLFLFFCVWGSRSKTIPYLRSLIWIRGARDIIFVRAPH